jgi:hypothetical protein
MRYSIERRFVPSRAMIVRFPAILRRFGSVRESMLPHMWSRDGTGTQAVIASEAKQSILPRKESWIASSLRSSQ